MLRYALLLAMASVLGGCIGVQVGTKPTSKTYEFASYSIDVPGDEWGVGEVDSSAERVEFLHASYAFMAGTVTSETKLGVFRVQPDNWSWSDEETANAYRDEMQRSIAKEAGQHAYEVKDIRRGVTEIAGKKLYTMSFEGGVGNWFVGGQGYTTFLYLYFPSDYERRHAFYVFALSTTSVKGSIYSESPNVKLVGPFVSSFKLKELPPP
ncbi:MAG TPA: hypothetical protein VMT17_13120 [Anaeromyxobacteraceae bacterium]|nr:hypothetical protein [Anaeromyxobacteraceae bacterium]